MSQTLFSPITQPSTQRQRSSKNWSFGLWSVLLALGGTTLPHAAQAVEQSEKSHDEIIGDQRRYCLSKHDLNDVLEAFNTPIDDDQSSMYCNILIESALSAFAEKDNVSSYNAAQHILQTHVAKNMSNVGLLQLTGMTDPNSTREQTVRMMQIMKESGLLAKRSILCQVVDYFIEEKYAECFETWADWASKSADCNIKLELSRFSFMSKDQMPCNMLKTYYDRFIGSYDTDTITDGTKFRCALVSLIKESMQYNKLKDVLNLTSGHAFWSGQLCGGNISTVYCIESIKNVVNSKYQYNETLKNELLQWIDKEVQEAKFISDKKHIHED